MEAVIEEQLRKKHGNRECDEVTVKVVAEPHLDEKQFISSYLQNMSGMWILHKKKKLAVLDHLSEQEEDVMVLDHLMKQEEDVTVLGRLNVS